MEREKLQRLNDGRKKKVANRSSREWKASGSFLDKARPPHAMRASPLFLNEKAKKEEKVSAGFCYCQGHKFPLFFHLLESECFLPSLHAVTKRNARVVVRFLCDLTRAGTFPLGDVGGNKRRIAPLWRRIRSTDEWKRMQGMHSPLFHFEPRWYENPVVLS